MSDNVHQAQPQPLPDPRFALRGGQVSSREFLFEHDNMTIDLIVVPGQILGQIETGGSSGQSDLRVSILDTNGEAIAEDTSDAHGFFRFPLDGLDGLGPRFKVQVTGGKALIQTPLIQV